METVAARQGELIIMDKSGDTKIMWDSSKPAEVDHARETFNSFKKKGYLAYSVKKNGDKGEVIREFDADAERLILAPQTVGG